MLKEKDEEYHQYNSQADKKAVLKVARNVEWAASKSRRIAKHVTSLPRFVGNNCTNLPCVPEVFLLRPLAENAGLQPLVTKARREKTSGSQGSTKQAIKYRENKRMNKTAKFFAFLFT